MIRVTVELVPFGREADKRVLKQMEIANDGTGTNEYGNYKVYEPSGCADDRKRLSKAGSIPRVLDHDRSRSMWELVWRALDRIRHTWRGYGDV
jgi:hypothetical protein